MVFLHVIVAVFSLIFTSYTYLHPTKSRLKIAYFLVGGTLATGVYLVWSAPAHMLEACMMGLFYLALVSVGIVAARTRLAATQIKEPTVK